MTALTREPSCKPGVNQRRRLVDPASDPRNNPLDDPAQMGIGTERCPGQVQPAAAFHIDAV